jgi:hypothetical protein
MLVFYISGINLFKGELISGKAIINLLTIMIIFSYLLSEENFV